VQLKHERFDKLFTSPLARATETADIVWNGGVGQRTILEGLREVDLYSFQGLMKAEGIERFGSEFQTWQKAPAEFSIDGQRPVVELWHRASLAWQQILLDPEVDSCALVVAHNAVNQALVGTAVGIGPDKFRRLLQSNAATTVLDFVPRVGGGPPIATIDRLNQVGPRPPMQRPLPALACGVGCGRCCSCHTRQLSSKHTVPAQHCVESFS
jgi:2-carboxy-D-arabinitol-1-phosphatase